MTNTAAIDYSYELKKCKIFASFEFLRLNSTVQATAKLKHSMAQKPSKEVKLC